MWPRSLVLPLVLAAGPAAGVAAQDPADRAGLDGLRDSLAAVIDSVALKRLEGATVDRAKRDRVNALLHLRLGFIAYRLGEIGRGAAKSHFEDAAGEFEWATELRPEWPYAWYGLGLAELALGEHSIIAIENLRQQLGKDYLSKAARAFARAVEADPAFAHATIELANTALAQRVRPRLDVALEAVRLAAASAGGRHPDVQLVRGRIEREVGEVDSALAGFGAYLAAGGDSGIGQLELARTLYFARRAEARRTYFVGARAAASPAATVLYRADVGWVAAPGDLEEFDALATPNEQAEWLERFWERRDVAEARAPGERLAEHYRRWFHVKRNFRLVSRHRHYDITEVYRSDQVDFDDRGIVYLRHGEPDERAQYPMVLGRIEPNESWLYRRPEADLIFHFVARGDVQDFKLVQSLADALTEGFGGAVRLQTEQRAFDPVLTDLFASRAALSPVYTRLGGTLGASTRGNTLAAERGAGQRSIAVGTTSDSYRHRFPLSLDVVASDFVVGGDTAGPGQTLHLVFAIPAGRLAPEADGAGQRYPLRFRVVVADAEERPVAHLDTTRIFGSREPLRGGSYLVGRLAVPVPAGAYRYRFLVSTPDGAAGDLITRDSLVVQRLDGTRFAASDLVLGREGSGLYWALATDTVLLNPLGRFPEGSAAELYYEVYGLARGTPYHTVVSLEKEDGRSLLGPLRGLFGGRRSPVLLEFDAVADGPVTRVHRALVLRDAPRGTYRLSVVVTDPASGRTFTRTRRLHVVARE